MHNNQHNLKTHNMSKLLVIVLSIILLTGISLVPTLQIGVQGQVRQSPAPPTPGTIAPPASSAAPPTPGGSPSSGSYSPPASSAAPSSPGGSPSSGSYSPPASYPAAPPSPGGNPSSGSSSLSSPTTSPALDTAEDGGGAANQTGGEGGGGAVNQSAVVMIPQSTMQMIMSQLQDAMTAIDSNNKDNATKAMNSVDQELKSAANASGISIETTTG
jgi:hypothetical protein